MNASSDTNDQGAPKKPQRGNDADLTQAPEPEIAKPTLGDAEISADVAESVDLAAVESEAAAVEHEAELAAERVSTEFKNDAEAVTEQTATPAETTNSIAPDDVTGEAPPAEVTDPASELSATAGSKAEPETGTIPAPHPAIGDEHGWRRPETPWTPKSGQWQSPAQLARAAEEAAASGTGPTPEPAGIIAPESAVAAEETATAPTGDPAPSSSLKKLLLLIVGALVAVGLITLVLWLIVGFFTTNSAEESAAPAPIASSAAAQPSGTSTETAAATETNPEDGVIEPALSPLKWRSGDCLRNFDNQSVPADVVLCSSPHNAQLVGTYYYDDSAEYPGVDALKAKAKEVCDNVDFAPIEDAPKTLQQSKAYPTEGTWNDQNDRRVDCMVHDTREGNALEVDLLK